MSSNVEKVVTACPSCGNKKAVSAAIIGRRVRCKKCDEPFVAKATGKVKRKRPTPAPFVEPESVVVSIPEPPPVLDLGSIDIQEPDDEWDDEDDDEPTLPVRPNSAPSSRSPSGGDIAEVIRVNKRIAEMIQVFLIFVAVPVLAAAGWAVMIVGTLAGAAAEVQAIIWISWLLAVVIWLAAVTAAIFGMIRSVTALRKL